MRIFVIFTEKILSKFWKILKKFIINYGEYSEEVRVTILNYLRGKILKKKNWKSCRITLVYDSKLSKPQQGYKKIII